MRAFRFALALPWAVFTAWMFVYAMPVSGLFAVGGLWALWPSRGDRSTLRSVAAVGIVAAGLVAAPSIGLWEYAGTTNALHCRTLGFTGARAPADCDPAELARGERAAADDAPLFSRRERLGVHGFNHALALGGLVVGLPEVAHETVALSWTSDPLPEDVSLATRRAQCRASWTAADAAMARLGPEREVVSDFPMRSARIRTRIAGGLSRLGRKEGATLDLGEVHFVTPSTNIDAYAGAAAGDSVRVALALEVGDSRLSLERLAGGAIGVAWTGTIHYPGTDVAFAVPIPGAGRVLRVSEAVFCGMHVDGAMNPYHLTYRWTLSPDDPRLDAERDRSERNAFEAALAGVIRSLPG